MLGNKRFFSREKQASWNQPKLDEVRLEAALGHKQELSRHFGVFSLTSLGVIIAK